MYKISLDEAEDLELNLPERAIFKGNSYTPKTDYGFVIQSYTYDKYYVGQVVNVNYSDQPHKIQYFFKHKSYDEVCVMWDEDKWSFDLLSTIKNV